MQQPDTSSAGTLHRLGRSHASGVPFAFGGVVSVRGFAQTLLTGVVPRHTPKPSLFPTKEQLLLRGYTVRAPKQNVVSIAGESGSHIYRYTNDGTCICKQDWRRLS